MPKVADIDKTGYFTPSGGYRKGRDGELLRVK
jgi:hypothetical protein